jgi:hypothetical protein
MTTIQTPFAGELCLAPELAILTTLEAALATTIQVMLAIHPELEGTTIPLEDFVADVKVAATIARQATQLLATVNRYRLTIFDPDFGAD